MIENLPILMPDPARNARTLSRCHDRLAARRHKVDARNIAPNRRAAITVEGLLLASVCVVCLLSMAGDVLATFGAL